MSVSSRVSPNSAANTSGGKQVDVFDPTGICSTVWRLYTGDHHHYGEGGLDSALSFNKHKNINQFYQQPEFQNGLSSKYLPRPKLLEYFVRLGSGITIMERPRWSEFDSDGPGFFLFQFIIGASLTRSLLEVQRLSSFLSKSKREAVLIRKEFSKIH